MVKSQANTLAFGFAATTTARIPNTQVSHSRGRRITLALKVVLSARSDKMMVERMVRLYSNDKHVFDGMRDFHHKCNLKSLT